MSDMTNPTGPRVEAATLALLETANYEISISAESLRGHLASEHCGDCTKDSCPCMRCICEEAQKEAAYVLKAADEAAWQPIESAPKDGTIINVLLPQDISEDDRAFYCYPKSRVSFGWAWGKGEISSRDGSWFDGFHSANPLAASTNYTREPMTPITKEEAISRLPRSPTGWIYPTDADLPVFEALAAEGIAVRRDFGFQMKGKDKK